MELLGPSAVIQPALIDEIVTFWKKACPCYIQCAIVSVMTGKPMFCMTYLSEYEVDSL